MPTWWHLRKNHKSTSFWEIPGWWTHPWLGGSPSLWESPEIGKLQDFTLYISSSGCSSVSFTICLVNWYTCVFLDSVNHSSELVKPEEGVLETWDLEPIGQKHSGQVGLVIGVWSGGGAVLQCWALYLSGLMLSSC